MTWRRARDWVFTVPFLLAFGLVLLLFDLLQRPARALGRRPHEVVVNGLQKSLVAALRVCGTRFAVERAGGLAAGRPTLFVSNHQSMFDIPILGAILAPHYLKFVSKRELARRWIPSTSRTTSAAAETRSSIAAIAPRRWRPSGGWERRRSPDAESPRSSSPRARARAAACSLPSGHKERWP